jgi:transcriptional regulator with XRE-family HTH domain
MDLKRLGNILQDRRETLGIPAAVLARRAGIARSTLWMVENGENPRTEKPSRLSKDKLERLMTVLRIDPQEQLELLNLAGYDTDLGSKLQFLSRTGSQMTPESGSVLASPPLSKSKRKLTQRIDALLSSEHLSEEDVELISDKLLTMAHELVDLMKATRKSGDESPDNTSQSDES